MTHFTLYHLPGCPFCLKVRRAAAELGIGLTLIDVSEDRDARAYLIEKRGRATVPVLAIPVEDSSGEGVVLLPESDDIIAYLRSLPVSASEISKEVA